jgi:hypothetical protein
MDASPFLSVEGNDMRPEPLKKATVLVLSVLLIAFVLCLGRALWNEDRPMVVLWSMFRLEITGAKGYSADFGCSETHLESRKR